MSRFRYDPEHGEKIFEEFCRDPSQESLKLFTIKWRDSRVSFITGYSIADATHKARYTKAEVDNIMSWEVKNVSG